MPPRQFYKTGERVVLNRSFEDWEPGRTISCGNGSCNKVQRATATVQIPRASAGANPA